eukprot:CAMPEP_0178426124 /NCGR_PEP_ID=MMETSP0689_2-20121128/29075_1 /TAXON_ID=160604 /ORGANISM="Amphidinium massartii, Strain CS-259" /LENGTH=133 /DNA_ID=CAMNT_0020047805 /DNA_START=892 /DNA_END=1289 /DNA_ORIENTATION=-
MTCVLGIIGISVLVVITRRSSGFLRPTPHALEQRSWSCASSTSPMSLWHCRCSVIIFIAFDGEESVPDSNAQPRAQTLPNAAVLIPNCWSRSAGLMVGVALEKASVSHLRAGAADRSAGGGLEGPLQPLDDPS